MASCGYRRGGCSVSRARERTFAMRPDVRAPHGAADRAAYLARAAQVLAARAGGLPVVRLPDDACEYADWLTSRCAHHDVEDKQATRPVGVSPHAGSYRRRWQKRLAAVHVITSKRGQGAARGNGPYKHT
jgi:hypothetical protein